MHLHQLVPKERTMVPPKHITKSLFVITISWGHQHPWTVRDDMVSSASSPNGRWDFPWKSGCFRCLNPTLVASCNTFASIEASKAWNHTLSRCFSFGRWGPQQPIINVASSTYEMTNKHQNACIRLYCVGAVGIKIFKLASRCLAGHHASWGNTTCLSLHKHGQFEAWRVLSEMIIPDNPRSFHMIRSPSNPIWSTNLLLSSAFKLSWQPKMAKISRSAEMQSHPSTAGALPGKGSKVTGGSRVWVRNKILPIKDGTWDMFKTTRPTNGKNSKVWLHVLQELFVFLVSTQVVLTLASF